MTDQESHSNYSSRLVGDTLTWCSLYLFYHWAFKEVTTDVLIGTAVGGAAYVVGMFLLNIIKLVIEAYKA